MANIFQFAVTSIPNLAAVIKAFRSTVVIGGKPAVGVSGSGVVANLINSAIGNALVGGVTIYAQTYKETADSDVSTQLMMAKENTKQWVSDNIAPRPRTWQISGYITTISGIEPVGIFSYTLLTKKRQLLEMRNSREVLNMKTMDNEIVNVAIVELSFDHEGQTMNGIPVTLKLQEMLVVSVSSVDPTFDAASPVAGSTDGTEVDAGAASSTALSDSGVQDTLYYFNFK